MDSIASIASEHGLKIVEDCAEYHGGILCDRADASCWSFYRNKIVAGEEGGMISFRDEEHAELARCLRCQGFTPAHDFVHVPRGINARMSNVHAELILRSLENADTEILRRTVVANEYDGIVPDEYRMPHRDVVWVYDLILPEGADIAAKVRKLNEHGIAARMGFKPMSEQPEFRSEGYEHLNAYRLSRRVMYLPVDQGPSLDVGKILFGPG